VYVDGGVVFAVLQSQCHGFFGAREARRREQKHECLAFTFALSLSLSLSLLSLSLSLSDAEQWNGPKLGKGRRIRDLKALKDDVDRFLEGGFSPKYRFPAVGYNGTDETRSKESENIHRWINESCLIISVSVFYS
jgi:hypothetical protein